MTKSSTSDLPFTLLSIDHIEDALARDLGPTNGSHLGSTSPAPSRNLTSGLALIPALIFAPVATPAPALPFFDKLFRQFMKAYLETNQRPRQSPMECKRPLKAKVPEVYYDKLHINCYNFCQQCKDYFETSEAIGANRTPFAAFFLCGNINMR